MSNKLDMRLTIDAESLPDAWQQLMTLLDVVEGALLKKADPNILNDLLAERNRPPATDGGDPAD